MGLGARLDADYRFLRLVKRADPGWNAEALDGKIERTTCGYLEIR